jgi:diadenosine tetraphosphate (Ap4A) HIT family hydrolase
MCVFCEYLENREKIIYENKLAFAIYDSFPVNKGHMLIMPKRHVASYFDLTDDEKNAIYLLLEISKNHIDQLFHPDGYNIGVNEGVYAGQTIMHCHVHLIPRYIGDVKNPKGGIRGVIPEKQKY